MKTESLHLYSMISSDHVIIVYDLDNRQFQLGFNVVQHLLANLQENLTFSCLWLVQIIWIVNNMHARMQDSNRL